MKGTERLCLRFTHQSMFYKLLGWVPQDLDEFVRIAPSMFLMGSMEDHLYAHDDEKPQREVQISFSYWVAKYPVTNMQFDRFMRAGSYDNPTLWSQEGWDWRTGNYDNKLSDDENNRWLSERPVDQRGQPWYWDNSQWNNPIFPVVGVSWFEAQAYCNWMTQQSLMFEIPEGYVVRLPTEQEWERAARFTDGREYPWSGEFELINANVAKSPGNGDGTTAVCTYPLGKSHEGVWDLSGNVWEWTISLNDKTQRILRGGSWNIDYRGARCAVRRWANPDIYFNNFGFRCVVSQANFDK